MSGRLRLALHAVEQGLLAKHTVAMQAARAYTEHLEAGGDATKMPVGQPDWWKSPIKDYVQALNNAWREQQGLVPIPYTPADNRAYSLFEAMLDGEWHSLPELRQYTRGAQVPNLLKDWKLTREGWLLDKASGSPVRYRLVRLPAEVAE